MKRSREAWNWGVAYLSGRLGEIERRSQEQVAEAKLTKLLDALEAEPISAEEAAEAVVRSGVDIDAFAEQLRKLCESP
jgi:hypothetical protein